MGGSALPVVINSGSGNQGLTVSLPVIEYARELKVDHDTLQRALIVSNLVALEQKEYIGKLSAYCGAVSAAVGSGAGITYLCGGDYDKIAMTITNAIATVGGMLCDGAKSSCAAKISTALEAAITAHEMSMQGKCFLSGEGLVGIDVEKTIRNIGNVGKIGMHATDIEIMKIMLEE
jgi:L-cysteine desulfidase